MNSQVVDLDRFKLAHESGGVDGFAECSRLGKSGRDG